MISQQKAGHTVGVSQGSRDQVKITVGIDVGARARGFHAVAFKNRNYIDKLHSKDPTAVAEWCARLGAQSIGVDAPCRWSASGGSRRAERGLMADRISCFATPSLQVARSHPGNYYGWMLNGMELYSRLIARGYDLFDGAVEVTRPICFETFPQAIACALAGERVSAKHKRQVRRALLQQRAIDTTSLTSIDWIDAALCAFTAHCFASGATKRYGDPLEGFIVVPERRQSAS
jgi:predicted nuclease with RNAse H fold